MDNPVSLRELCHQKHSPGRLELLAIALMP